MENPPACLMLTSFSDDEALFTAIMAGAAGYLLKQVSGTDLIGAVRRLAAGESLLDPAMTTAVLERLRHPAEDDEDPRYKSLTEQERRILDEIAAGKTNRQIAQSHVPGREDGEELRLRAAPQARHGTPHRGRCLRRRAGEAPPTAVILRQDLGALCCCGRGQGHQLRAEGPLGPVSKGPVGGWWSGDVLGTTT